jgi:hypothetical protein
LKRLGIFSAAASNRGIAGVADPDISSQALQVFRCEDIQDQAVPFFGMELSVIRDNSGRILASMLNSQEPLVKVPESMIVSKNSDYTAHGYELLSYLFRTQPSSCSAFSVDSLER